MTPTLSPVARTIATVCAAVLSCALALGIGDYVGQIVHGTDSTTATPDSSPVYAPDHVDCPPFVLDEDTDYTHLVAAGWYSDPDDGMEALYAPECR